LQKRVERFVTLQARIHSAPALRMRSQFMMKPRESNLALDVTYCERSDVPDS
jgi:hypothetical protein